MKEVLSKVRFCANCCYTVLSSLAFCFFSNLMGRQGQMYWIDASEFEPIVEQTAWCWQGCPAKEAVDKLAVDDKYFLQPAPVSDSYKWSVVSTLFVFYLPFPTIIPSLISSCLSIEAVRSYWKKVCLHFSVPRWCFTNMRLACFLRGEAHSSY